MTDLKETTPKEFNPYSRCPDELQFRVEKDEAKKEFTAIVRLLWHAEESAVEGMLSGFSAQKKAEDVGCKRLFDRVKYVYESKGVLWELGDDFRPQGSRVQ